MKKSYVCLRLMLLGLALALAACSSGEYGGDEKGVSFAAPYDGATVSSPVTVVMKVKGMYARPAGELIDGTGHHHLIIDGAFVPEGETVPKDATHKHFGKGQKEASIDLSPGEHTLTLQFADGQHGSYGEAMSRTIHITVE